MSALYTRWGKSLDRHNPLPEYPRPQLQRDSFINLNGVWQYAFTKTEDAPLIFDGDIVVPFSPEAPLSGVERQLQKDEYLHYFRTFSLPHEFCRDRVLLHFDAVDQIADVFINNKNVAHHEGGYWPFVADITDSLVDGTNELRVAVRDNADDDSFAYGKQKYVSGGIWYTQQSGIWQTVWLESVPENYIVSLAITPLFDDAAVRVEACASRQAEGAVVEVLAADGTCVANGVMHSIDDSEKIANHFDSAKTDRDFLTKSVCVIPLHEFCAWSPDDPYLYHLKITLGDDIVQSYFGMRKFSYVMNNGCKVFALNNKPYFHNGLLDQGYWPDGLLTPPSDDALVFDIATMKACGFNMLRKHIKIEGLRWYYHCDRLGMLVWQDIVSGGQPYSAPFITVIPLLGINNLSDKKYKRFGRASKVSREQYRIELEQTISHLFNCTCIALWTPFNEGWGQFDALDIAQSLRALDETRYIDHASGWHDQGHDEMQSRHIYFKPIRMKNDGRALCLTEFGGYILKVDGHAWCEKPFGYRTCKNEAALAHDYKTLFEKQVIPHFEREGLAATVYTQLSDVEQEMNGLLTYDREVLKIPQSMLQEINKKLLF
ncbi:MAG: glycoside hydrolase family 2 [Treponema sp.]|nr:glycoside hydrolase family 2 [Treponema sp.]